MSRATTETFKVGDAVLVRFPGDGLAGFVNEVRGPLGGGGRTLYGVTLPVGESEEEVLYGEFTAEEMERLPREASAA